jgi:hypothetical protein
LSGGAHEILLVGRIGDEAHFNENGWCFGVFEDIEIVSAFGAAAGKRCFGFELVGYCLCQ